MQLQQSILGKVWINPTNCPLSGKKVVNRLMTPMKHMSLIGKLPCESRIDINRRVNKVKGNVNHLRHLQVLLVATQVPQMRNLRVEKVNVRRDLQLSLRAIKTNGAYRKVWRTMRILILRNIFRIRT